MNSITVILALVAMASVSAAGSDIVRHRSGRFGHGGPRGHSSPQIPTGEAEATRHSAVADNATTDAAISTETVTSATVSDETTTATSSDTSKTDALNAEVATNAIRETTTAVDAETTTEAAENTEPAVNAEVASNATPEPVRTIEVRTTTYSARKPAAPVNTSTSQNTDAEVATNAARKPPVVNSGVAINSVRKSTPAITGEATSASAYSAFAAANAAAVADEAAAANNFASNDNRAADSDAHALALQISLQNQQNRASNAQAVVDQASAIRQRSIINAIAARANSRALAQSADNVAGKRRNHVNSRTSILAGLINAGSARDARINQAAFDSQTASILAATAAASARQMAAIRAQIAFINRAALVNARISGAGPLGLGSVAGFGW